MTKDADQEATPDLRGFLLRISEGSFLNAAEAEEAFGYVMSGTISDAQTAALLMGLRTRRVTPPEVAGGVRALRHAMLPVAADDPDTLTDTCGTGGGSVTTFNISTVAALVAAGAGARIAKHGNRSFTSKSGSADVLEALDVRIEMDPESMAEVLREVGIVFMYAPLLHPAMRFVGPVRRELGIPTIMNILGPLTNPAGARRQVVGVSDPELLRLVAETLRELGHLRGMVVHGSPGMDELSPCGPTRALSLVEGEIREATLTPEELGLECHDVKGLAGGSPEENAAVIRSVLDGSNRGAARAATLLNAGAAVYVAGLEEDLTAGIARARDALDSGAALRKLGELGEASRSVG